MKIYVLSLKASVERIQFQLDQFARLAIEAEIVEAITPETLSDQSDESYWRTWERPIKATERACFMSHLGLWKRVAACQNPALILEDDVILSDSISSFLKQVSNLSGVDHLSLETRARKKLISLQSFFTIDSIDVHKLFIDRSGAAAYVLWPSGAHKLITKASSCASLADAMICQASDLASFQAVPAQAYQSDMCDFFGRKNPLHTRSTVSSFTRPNSASDGLLQMLIYKYRRLKAQASIGLRTIKLIGISKRVLVMPYRD
jgi:glycosyl transferase family 25